MRSTAVCDTFGTSVVAERAAITASEAHNTSIDDDARSRSAQSMCNGNERGGGDASVGTTHRGTSA